MSLIEEVHNVQERVLARLRELEPLVAEHRELSELAKRLGLDTGPTPTAAGAVEDGGTARRRATRRRSAPKRAATRSRRAGQTREEQVLAAVKAQPGITVGQIAKQLGVDATALYRAVRKLTTDGAITKRGLQLHPN
jgi:transcriptional regulator of acetoin/glycerol metabolism